MHIYWNYLLKHTEVQDLNGLVSKHNQTKKVPKVQFHTISLLLSKLQQKAPCIIYINFLLLLEKSSTNSSMSSPWITAFLWARLKRFSCWSQSIKKASVLLGVWRTSSHTKLLRNLWQIPSFLKAEKFTLTFLWQSSQHHLEAWLDRKKNFLERFGGVRGSQDHEVCLILVHIKSKFLVESLRSIFLILKESLDLDDPPSLQWTKALLISRLCLFLKN